MNRRDFCLMLPALFAGCGGSEDDMREIGRIQPSPTIKKPGTGVYGGEDIWTPEITFDTPGNLSVAYSLQRGYYFVMETIVFVSFQITTSSFTHTTASGNLKITGLPFKVAGGSPPLDSYLGAIAEAVAAAGAYAGGGNVHWSGIIKASYTDMYLNPVVGQSYLTLIASGSAQTRTTVVVADTPTLGTVVLGGFAFYPKVIVAT